MNVFGRLHRLKSVIPVINTAQPRRLKVADVKDVVGWKFVEQPSKLTAAYSGDLALSEQVDLRQPQVAVQVASDVISSTDEVTKRVLSLEFARAREHTMVLEDQAVRHVQRHRFDTESPEAKVASLTAKIRRYQQLLTHPKDRRQKALRVNVMTMVGRRGRQLRCLRATDYKRFEWLLQQLNIVYRPLLPYKADTTLSRKGGIRSMVQIFCDNIRLEKLDALRRQLNAQKPEFERERRAAVEWIAAEERALGLPPSVDAEKGVLLEPRLPKRVVVPPRREQPTVA